MKICSACGELKPLETGFHRKSASSDGYTNECRVCRNQKNAAWRAENPDYHRNWVEENKDYVRTHQRARREKAAQEKQNPAPYNDQYQQKKVSTNSGLFVNLIVGGF